MGGKEGETQRIEKTRISIMAQQTVETTKMATENMFQVAGDSFKTAMDAGLKFQKDAFDTMNKMFCCGDYCGDMTDKAQETTTEAVNFVRKSAEQTQKMFDENCRNGLATMRKSFDVMQADDKDMMTRASDIWSNAFDTMRGNVEATAKSATQAIENWSDFMTKSIKTGAKKAAK